ncbi:MAG: hypothetical protein A2086_06870 [Spirochaetes bacterium GWD1_27_9]|nr:MAG: hypothetical protein A2Z98_18660 [Spirochaetes bacterium GWB1_27_13]OHD20243.1 MAG: hypothetical protein A2Y34_04900 [Spirochaetes bacterium GWC1_27_15]OHD42617.1 MAG: hypothetical protein A2086_06870 [Spirochaetes bacterium GWD1_27_9]
MELNAEIIAMINKSDSKLKTAKIVYNNEQYADCMSSSYYAVFHIISACLLSKNLTFSSHSQTIGAFNKEFIKTGIFPKEYTAIIQGLFEDRQNGDYNVYFTPDRDMAFDSIKQTEIIINSIKDYLLREKDKGN